MKSLIIGGVKSGKSHYAESIAVNSSFSNTLVATATANDVEMTKRIQHHQQSRDKKIAVIEEPIYLGKVISQFSKNDCVLIDCLTLWITNLLMIEDNSTSLEIEKNVLLDAVDRSNAKLVIVSNETNMGIVPLGEISRRYCDEIGLLHQALARRCDEVVLMVAGLPHKIK